MSARLVVPARRDVSLSHSNDLGQSRAPCGNDKSRAHPSHSTRGSRTPGITCRADNETGIRVLRMRATLFAVGCMPLLAGGAATATLVFPAAPARARLIAPDFYATPPPARLPQIRPARYADAMISGLPGMPPAMPAVRSRRIP